MGISIYYIAWIFSEPRRKNGPEVEGLEGPGRKEVSLYHDIFKVTYLMKSLLLGSWFSHLLFSQGSSFAWLYTYPFSTLIINHLDDLETFCFIICEDPNILFKSVKMKEKISKTYIL